MAIKQSYVKFSEKLSDRLSTRLPQWQVYPTFIIRRQIGLKFVIHTFAKVSRDGRNPDMMVEMKSRLPVGRLPSTMSACSSYVLLFGSTLQMSGCYGLVFQSLPIYIDTLGFFWAIQPI